MIIPNIRTNNPTINIIGILFKKAICRFVFVVVTATPKKLLASAIKTNPVAKIASPKLCHHCAFAILISFDIQFTQYFIGFNGWFVYAEKVFCIISNWCSSPSMS